VAVLRIDLREGEEVDVVAFVRREPGAGVRHPEDGHAGLALPAQPVTANVTGAQVVRLVVIDGGDGIDSDHADWADARLSC
jgi:hypothetical protein